jgi:N-acyl-D-amino-acid deacylase
MVAMFRVCLLLLAASAAAVGADYEILIRNARVVDGSGNPWFRADAGIRDGRIARVGTLEGATADRVIDAGGRILAPGFIDVHTHIETTLEGIPRADNFLLDGVTTVVTGNCGGSSTDLAAWFSTLEQIGLGINVASLIGHNSVRSDVMGTANRAASPEEIAKMQELVARAMKDGAVGFSTGLIYIPGTYADTAEVVALAKVAGRYGGVYASHMRDEGPEVMQAIEEAITVGREAKIPVELSHFKIDTKSIWGTSDKTLALVERYRGEGIDVVVDQYPYDHSSTNLGVTLPSWALADGPDAVKERLASPDTRARIVSEMLDKLQKKGQPDFSYATVARFDPDQALEGKTIAAINLAKGRPPTLESQAETVLDLVAAGGAQMVYHTMGDVDIDRILKYPNTAIASDGGIWRPGPGSPHPRSYGTNARVLAEYVRERKVISLEDAIRRMTSLPARTFGFHDRGLLREGMAADLVLFDPARVQDKATYEKPHQYSEGFDFVIVNGKVEVEGGRPNAVLAGRIVRHQP